MKKSVIVVVIVGMIGFAMYDFVLVQTKRQMQRMRKYNKKCLIHPAMKKTKSILQRSQMLVLIKATLLLTLSCKR
ncbi:hypothetical protein [Virgibacillus sp. DJP39]|uniref:hypothetical protein n=1 Tax=Virgibacillus sp. DJP39 TaxID=3409790 RepID=UPI003BB5112B